MKVDGSCHCGEVTYEAEVDPAQVTVCHCTDCQILGGTAFRTSLPVRRTAFVLLSGEPRIYIKTAESGYRRAQAFCPTCGTPLYAGDAHEPKTPRCASQPCASETHCRRAVRSGIDPRSHGCLNWTASLTSTGTNHADLSTGKRCTAN